MEKIYTPSAFIAKLRRLADCIENDEASDIQIAGERIYAPVRAVFNVEYERCDGEEEIEFQSKWRSDH
ncbi:MAG: amphi-Trp domain-containing protein [Pseudomonadota bacterium]